MNFIKTFKINNILDKYNTKVYLFIGEVGTGKTFFIRNFCIKKFKLYDIKSPTFTYFNYYQIEDNIQIFHIDLFREKSYYLLYEIYSNYNKNKDFIFIESTNSKDIQKIKNIIKEDILLINLYIDKNLFQSYNITLI